MSDSCRIFYWSHHARNKKYTVVDLFAGVGGLSYGFSRNDHFEIILANEMQKDIAKAYTINHPSVNMLQGDIKDLPKMSSIKR